MFLESLGEGHQREFAGPVLLPRGQGGPRVLESVDLAPDITGTRSDDDPDISVGRLGADGRAEDAK